LERKTEFKADIPDIIKKSAILNIPVPILHDALPGFQVVEIVPPMFGRVLQENIHYENSPIYFHCSHDSCTQADM